MNNVRTVLAKHKAYKRARRLWEEYLEVSELRDKVEADQRLSTFLDNFKRSYAELSAGPEDRETLDSIFGECTDILQSLLAMLEKKISTDGETNLADLLNNALEVAELLIRDEKYRQVVKDTPKLLSQIVDVLSIAGNPEAKKIVLRMISSFGSVSENKMMVGHQGGFQKMLTLLVEGDEDLSREVLKTLKHFLNVEIRQVREGSDDAAIGVVGGFALFSSQKIVHAMSGFTQIAFGEVNRMFPTAKIEERMQLVAANMVDTVAEEADLLRESMAFLLEGGEAGLFPPSRASLQHVYDQNESTKTAAQVALAPAGDSTDEATPLLSGTEDEVMKELMRMQGVLSTLTMSISEAARTVQLDMMETISRLLLNNPRNQHEFRRADGYSRFLQLLDRVTDYSAQENMVFVQDVFDTIFTIALDGNPERVVGNPDAMRLLVDLVCTGSSVVRIHAVRTLHDLLTVNYVNAAVLQTIDGDTLLTDFLLSQDAFPDGSSSDDDRAEFVAPLAKLLEYMIFLLSSHSMGPLGHVVRSLDQAQASATLLDAVVEEAMLKLVSNILCDLRARRAPFNVSELLPTVIDMLRRSFSAPQRFAGAETRPGLTRDRRLLLLLELMGVLVHDSPPLVMIVVERQGLTLLTSIICDKTGEDPRSCQSRRMGTDTALAVRHMALWILQDIIGASCQAGMDHTEWLVSLLNAQLPLELQLLVFAAVREVGVSSAVKRCFRTAGALDTLVEILRCETSPLVEPVLKTLAVLTRDSEENKSYVTEELLDGDYSVLLHAFGSMPMTLNNFRIAVELACVGPSYSIFSYVEPEPEELPAQQHIPPAVGNSDGDDERFGGNESSDDDGLGQSTGEAEGVAPPDFKSNERAAPTSMGRDSEDAVPVAAPQGQHPDVCPSATTGSPWHCAIRDHVQRIRDPQFLFLQGPPSLSRHYAFLIALQKRREQTSEDEDTGSLSPRSQMTSELRESDVLSQFSDSASESSSIRDSLDLAARDLALQALLSEQAGSKAGKVDGSRPSRWWELGRRKAAEPEPEPEPEESVAVPKGVKVRADSQTGSFHPDQVAGGRLGRQIITSMLKFDPQVTAGTEGVPFWRPGSGWAVASTRPASALDDRGTVLTPKVMIRGSTALSWLLELVLLSDDAVQQGGMVASLLRIAASGLAARRSICHAGGLQRCLQLCLDPRLSDSESVQRLVRVLASALGRYDISLVELRELFLMTYGAQSSRQQVHLLQVIAAIAQRWEPVGLIQLRGPVSAVTAPALDKFPKQQTGYTICTWIKLGPTLEPGENLVFCWRDPKYLIFELFFRVWPRERLEDGTLEPIPRRNLCVRMRNSPCTHTEYFTYDGFSFDNVDSWHHLVLTHNKQLLSLYVDGRYVQSFQPLNYPIGVSRTYPLRAVIGCPQEAETNAHTTFLERCTGTFCGELGLLHVTEGVWDARAARAAAKSFPYQRNLQAIGVNHKQLLCMDPLDCPSLPFVSDQRSVGHDIGENSLPGGADAMQSDDGSLNEDHSTLDQSYRLDELETWRELQREQTRDKQHKIERWRDDRPVVLSNDPVHDPFTSLAGEGTHAGPANAPSVVSEPSPDVELQNAATSGHVERAPDVVLQSPVCADKRSDLAAGPSPLVAVNMPTTSNQDSTRSDAEALPAEDLSTIVLEEMQKAVAPLVVQGDVDIHHMGSFHDVAHEIGDFFLPLPFLRMAPPQRALGLRVLLEMLCANEQTVRSFRDARAGSTVLYLLQGWCGPDGEPDPAFDSLFELLREQTLPVGECMQLIFDLMLIDNLPMQNNVGHLQTLSEVFLEQTAGEDGDEGDPDEEHMVQQWKETCEGMPAMMEVLSRSSGEQTRVVLNILRLMWEPSFTSEDLEMMLEFCVGTVEEMLSILEDGDSEDDDDEHITMGEDHTHDDAATDEQGVGIDHRAIEVRVVSGGDRVDVGVPVVWAAEEGEPDATVSRLQCHNHDEGTVPLQAVKDAGLVPDKSMYAYGYDSDDDVELGSRSEIDARVAHDLGIADCDFHDWLGDGDIADDRFDKLAQEPTDTDYAAQISEAKFEALVFVREILVAKPADVAVDVMRDAGGFQVPFALLSSPDERIRLLALDLIGLLVSHGKPADAKAFALAGGFDTVAKYLVRHWISRPVGWALLCLAVRTPGTIVDTSEWLEGRCNLSDPSSPSREGGEIASPTSGRSASDRSDEDAAPMVINFEALYCLLQLLQFGTTDKPVERDMSERLAEIMMAPHNLDQLLSHSFGDWCFSFFSKIQRHAATRRAIRSKSHVFQVVRRVNGALLLLNIPRALPPKTFKQLRKSISDAADFGIYLVDDVLDHYELSPVLSADDASNTVKNLAGFFDQLEEHTDIPVETCVCIVALINNMAVRNNSTSRNHMMTHKLLDTRDRLVLHCLKCDSSVETCYELVAMPFESVIEQPSFREKHGPLYLLRHMHRASCDPSLQVLFASVIKHVCCTVDENRKVIARVIDDVDISTRMLGNDFGENVTQWLRILPPRAGVPPGTPDGHGDSLTSPSHPVLGDELRSPMRLGTTAAASTSEVGSVVPPPASGASAVTTGGGAARFHPVSPARNRPVSPTSSIGSATSIDGGELMQDTIADCEDFLEWYHCPEQDEKREAIEARLEKLLAPADKSWRRLHERQLAARAKAFRSRVELARTKESALLDSFNEEDKKVRARVEKMGTNHLRRVQNCIAERRARFREGRAAWESLVAGTDVTDPGAKEADAASKFYGFAPPAIFSSRKCAGP